MNKIEDVKVGSVVHFRIGGKLKVRRADSHNGVFVNLQFEDFHQTLCYKKGGLKNSLNSFLDIVGIEPPLFDWTKVKSGTRVYTPAGGLMGAFIGLHPNNPEVIVLYNYDYDNCFITCNVINCRTLE